MNKQFSYKMSCRNTDFAMSNSPSSFGDTTFHPSSSSSSSSSNGEHSLQDIDSNSF